MKETNLDKLNRLKGKKVEIHLVDGEKMRCLPNSYLVDEEVTYLVETYESYGDYPINTLVELEEEEIKSIRAIE